MYLSYLFTDLAFQYFKVVGLAVVDLWFFKGRLLLYKEWLLVVFRTHNWGYFFSGMKAYLPHSFPFFKINEPWCNSACFCGIHDREAALGITYRHFQTQETHAMYLYFIPELPKIYSKNFFLRWTCNNLSDPDSSHSFWTLTLLLSFSHLLRSNLCLKLHSRV